ncbi:hypothetical protein BC332_16543 [Capsicum chinense]|nr:hypothetical protein BC332_16543 [Capsicum chinense]
MSSMKTMANMSKYCLDTRFIKSIKVARAFVRPKDMTINLSDHTKFKNLFWNIRFPELELLITDLKSINILSEPYFLSTNRIGAPHGEMLDLINPLSKRSFNCSFSSLSLDRVILYGKIDMGLVSRRRSIPKLIFLSGGTPRRSSGNTSGNSLTTETNSRVRDSKIEYLNRTK